MHGRPWAAIAFSDQERAFTRHFISGPAMPTPTAFFLTYRSRIPRLPGMVINRANHPAVFRWPHDGGVGAHLLLDRFAMNGSMILARVALKGIMGKASMPHQADLLILR